MRTDYDEKLMECLFFKNHKEYLPYIGENYKKYRILHIGESHYICLDGMNEQKYNLDYFKKNWFIKPCKEILLLDEGAYNTRGVVSDYLEYGLSDNRKYFYIFQNFINAFINGGLGEDEKSNNKREQYKNMAFMNFMQMPSLYEGESLYRSFERNAKYASVSAEDMWDFVVKESIDVLDYVIEALEPNLIVFTSILAGNAYKNNKGKFCDSSNILYLDHPSSSWWYRRKRTLKSSNERLEEAFRGFLY